MFLAWHFHFFFLLSSPSIILPLFLALSLFHLFPLSLFPFTISVNSFSFSLHFSVHFNFCSCLRLACVSMFEWEREKETGCRAYPCMLSKLEWTRAPISWLCQTPASPVTQGHLIFCLILRQSVCIFGWLCAGKLTINNKCGLKGCFRAPNTPPLQPTIHFLRLPRLSARVMKMSVVPL